MTSLVTMILAQDQSGAIGMGDKLPWPRISEDMKFFKDTTLNHVVIMGRRTFESLSEPLSDRTNVVLTRDPEWTAQGVVIFQQLEAALKEYEDNDEIFIIGGAEVYNRALRYADRILLTRVIGNYDADVYFRFNDDSWVLDSSRQYRDGDDKLICTFESYSKPVKEEVVGDTPDSFLANKAPES